MLCRHTSSLTHEFKDALTLFDGGNSLFLTGKAGTGKSTLVRHFLASTRRNVIVAAPRIVAGIVRRQDPIGLTYRVAVQEKRWHPAAVGILRRKGRSFGL